MVDNREATPTQAFRRTLYAPRAARAIEQETTFDDPGVPAVQDPPTLDSDRDQEPGGGALGRWIALAVLLGAVGAIGLGGAVAAAAGLMWLDGASPVRITDTP